MNHVSSPSPRASTSSFLLSRKAVILMTLGFFVALWLHFFLVRGAIFDVFAPYEQQGEYLALRNELLDETTVGMFFYVLPFLVLVATIMFLVGWLRGRQSKIHAQ